MSITSSATIELISSEFLWYSVTEMFDELSICIFCIILLTITLHAIVEI
jgi:hypothetical protein